jgi:hypothetical protein
MTDGETNTLALRGLVEPFFQLCCCVRFLFWREIGLGFTYYYVLRVSYSCGVVVVFLVLAGNRYWCYIHTKSTIQLCGCVSFFVVAGKLILYEFSCSIRIFFFFWFWWEIVLGVTYVLSVQYNCAVVSVFCCGGKVNFVQIPYSHDRFSKISRLFFVKKLIPYKTYVREDQLFLALYGSTTIQSILFLKNFENFVWFPKQYLLGFFILEKQLANILDRGFLVSP